MEEKERYELIGYCSYRDTETGVIGDNFVELLNQQDQKIKELEKALELACTEELREIGIYNDDLDYKKEMSILKQQYSEQAEKELKINDKDYNFEKLLEDKKC